MRFHCSLACLTFNSNPSRRPVWLRQPVILAMWDGLKVVTTLVSTITSSSTMRSGTSVLLLREVDRQLGLMDRLAGVITDGLPTAPHPPCATLLVPPQAVSVPSVKSVVEFPVL